MAQKLTEYKRKRDPKATPEPFGEERGGKAREPIFVVQRHDARRLHYDFRLELDGVLKSWAVPKGPSLNTADKRRIIDRLLTDEEWSRWSDRDIARHCGVSHEFVRQRRAGFRFGRK